MFVILFRCLYIVYHTPETQSCVEQQNKHRAQRKIGKLEEKFKKTRKLSYTHGNKLSADGQRKPRNKTSCRVLCNSREQNENCGEIKPKTVSHCPRAVWGMWHEKCLMTSCAWHAFLSRLQLKPVDIILNHYL